MLNILHLLVVLELLKEVSYHGHDLVDLPTLR
jgi:hypothetical protein